MKLIIFEDNSKYGYRDENDTIVIPAKYEDAKTFNDNCAIVKYNGFYGVINYLDEPVIDFIYTSVEEHYLFFECKTSQEHEVGKLEWYNKGGVLLHQGKAKALSEEFLCTSNGNKYGVIKQDGKRIVNCLYDKITLNKESLVVLRGDKLGLYDLNGDIILDAFCDSIESVVIDNDPMLLGNTTFSEKLEGCQYRGYCKDFYFDTSNTSHLITQYIHFWYGGKLDMLYREAVRVTSKHKVCIDNVPNTPEYFIDNIQTINDITKPMIVSSGNVKMIFTKSDGILPNSEFDDIQQITPICYVVKRDNLFGVYRVDTKELVIPIEYERIRFYGGHTVLVCKDNLWGAKSLVLDTHNLLNLFFKVSIPNEYLEIMILDDYQIFFGCKKKCSHSSKEYYTIVRSRGQEIYDISELECDSQFVYIDSSHFITSIRGKFGFINSQGQKIIPFKYDEVVAREDGNYNARINNRWGVLSIDGREITHIKYSSPLPCPFDKELIVKDAESECLGLIDSKGLELIPAVYEHLLSSEDDGLFYFGRGGFEDNDYHNFFSGDIHGANWGVVSRNGKIIIDAKYVNFEVQSDFIVAGRNGRYFSDTDDFDGVYDLYNKDGELLIGGFREFEYDERNGIFIFFFGGEWKEYSVFDDDWNNTHITGYKFERGIDLWLILDKDLKTIIRDKDGAPKQFEKGFIGRIEIKKEDDKIKHIYNMPIELMAKGFSHVAINSVIINDSNLEYHKSYAVDIATGKKTRMYSKIEQVTEKLFFFADGDNVGITNINSDVLIGECLLITYPINNYVLIGKKESEKNFSVLLYNLDNLAQPIAIAIQRISEDDLIHHAEGHWLKMEVDTSLSGSKSLIMPNSRFLENKFKELVSTKEGTEHKFGSYDNSYFFSNDWRFDHDEENYDDGGIEWQDYWDPSDAFDGEPDAYWNID